ncbi:hypothetical protein [Methylobacterium radiodurans]|uniref:Uncharacterized protein n=1 Tax=Methylobacterium radiodurans TaxID=2202828 RepID=A0A2U8VLS3_9HYPH|nr:hypothetical protein [Methylobacterium radiodurans]AWN34500.1 hypothetical protein DK427_01040 [Methylobacterium radiodurans]
MRAAPRAGLSAPARTVIAHAAYLTVVGLAFLLAPERVAWLLDVTGEPYLVRVIGLLTLCFAAYYAQFARHEDRPLIGASVPVRFCLAAAFVLLVMADLAPMPLLAFALVDVVGAAATALALRGRPTVGPLPAH